MPVRRMNPRFDIINYRIVGERAADFLRLDKGTVPGAV
jgi:hypothetical protein